jgi:hypothetical protein
MSDVNPLSQSGQPVAWNFKLLAQNDLGGFGGMGEGMSVQLAKDGRRIIWLAHESAPKNFTGVDVSDPRHPKVVVQTELPQAYMRSNSLECSGDIMAVAYQTQKQGQQPAGLELFDISVPEKPRSISFFDCSGPHSRGVHQLWFCDGEYVHMAAGAADFTPSNRIDDQFYRCIDVRNPAKPVEAGRWWMPGTRAGDNEPPPPRHALDKGYRAHNTNVDKERPDRLYLAYPVSIATCPLPPVDAYKSRGGRFGAHNLFENTPVPTAWHSDQIVIGTFFNGGLRAYDISNPYQPKEVAAFVPPPPKGTPAGAVQLNDVFVDERAIVYTVDRFTGGLYTLEMDF